MTNSCHQVIYCIALLGPLFTDGKLYDAYVSYANSTDDRKFVNFIVKPQLENRHGYKLFLDDKDILPNAGRGSSIAFNSFLRHSQVVLNLDYRKINGNWPD